MVFQKEWMMSKIMMAMRIINVPRNDLVVALNNGKLGISNANSSKIKQKTKKMSHVLNTLSFCSSYAFF
jgi:hypothetical protein